MASPSRGGATASQALQSWDPGRYARNARFVADLGEPLIALLDPRPGERILDIGCGDGALTLKLAETGAAVVGIDSAPEQVRAARALGLDAHVADGQILAFDGEFDGILSNAALHWMRHADAAIDSMWRALRPGGRIAAEMGGKGNVATIHAALVGELERLGIDAAAADPWYFPTAADYRQRLEGAGFRVERIELLPRPTPLPGELADWLQTFGESFFAAAPAEQQHALIDNVVRTAGPALRQDDGSWVADYVRLRFLAVKPPE